MDLQLSRANKDRRINAFGRHLVEVCIKAQLYIVNGRVHKDRNIGEYTYISSNGSSSVDYIY